MKRIQVLVLMASAFSAASSFAQTTQPRQLPRDEFALSANGAPEVLAEGLTLKILPLRIDTPD